VDVNLSEEEQVEALKKWWKENGKSVVAGVVIGLGGVFGWQAWVDHQQGVAAQASYQFEQLNTRMSQDVAAASAQAEALIDNHDGTVYAHFAALDLAKMKLEGGDKTGARAQYQWVIDRADNAPIKQIARLRLARVMMADGDLDGASSILAHAKDDSFRGEVAELKGDIARANGDVEGARQAYARALEGNVSSSVLVQMKLDDLAVAAN